jgi:hypothetical protein
MAKRSAAALLGATANSRASGWWRQIWKHVKNALQGSGDNVQEDGQESEYLSL